MEKEVREVTPDGIRERPNYEEEILEIVSSNEAFNVLKKKLAKFHQTDLADALSLMNHAQQQKFFRLLSDNDLAELFENLDEDEILHYLNQVPPKKAVTILNKMETDITADLLDTLEDEQKQSLIAKLDPALYKKISTIAAYNDDLIGSEMTANFIEIPKNYSVEKAMKTVIDQAPANDNISTIYVLDDNDRYYGAITLPDLITAPNTDTLEDITSTSYPFVYANDPIDSVLEELRDYNEDSIPVLSASKRLLGIITSQDLLEVYDEELSEDYVKLGAVTHEEDLQEPLKQSVKKRLPWLLTLLLLGLVVSFVISLYEGIVAQLTIIMTFQSLILDMSGNVGTQSLAVTIRVISDEKLNEKERMKLVLKEFRIGFVEGFIMGISTMAFVLVFLLFRSYDFFHAAGIASCVGVALWTAMTFSSITGTIFPLTFQRFNIDPAVASGPLITTVNDLIGVVTYYSLAFILLIQIMHL